ncbi:uncharacterized protein V6R79_019232 [Siganus canaliculatus]
MERLAVFTNLILFMVLCEVDPALAVNQSKDGLTQKPELIQVKRGTKPSTETSSMTCKLQGTIHWPAFSMDGDYVIGGVFSIHHFKHTVLHNYSTLPDPVKCTGSIDSRELRLSHTMVFAIEEINNSTELLPGIRLGYQVHDSCAAVNVATQVVLQLSSGQDPAFYMGEKCSHSGMVMAIIGESGSTPSISMSRVIGSFHIPQVSHFATCACLSNKQQYPTFFRTIPSDQFQADALAKLVKHFGWTWIGAVCSDSDYGNNGMAAFLEAAQKEGICVEYSEAFYRTHPHSRIQRVADVIRRSTAVVVVAFAASGDLRILLEELSHEPSPPRQWIGSEAWVTDPHMLRFRFCTGAIGFGIQKSVIPGLREFLLDLSPSTVAASPLLTEFWEDAFNCRLRKDEAREERVCDGSEDIQTLQNPYTDTSQLRITNMVYKAVYAIAHAIHNAVCHNTNSTTQCDKTTRTQAKKVLSQLKKVNFSQNGYSVSFDASGDPVAKYELVNWQKTESGIIEMVTVGFYDASLPMGEEFRINKNMTWMEGGTQVPVSVCSDSCPPGTRKVLQKGKPICCYDCIPCPEGEISNSTDSTNCFPCPIDFWPNAERDTCLPKPVEFLSFDEVLGIILAAFSVAGACLAIITAAVFFHHRTSPIVRANNSELSFLLLFSLTLCFLCSLTFIGAPSEWSCRLRHTAFGITFVLCISFLDPALKQGAVPSEDKTGAGNNTGSSSVTCKLQGTARQPAFAMDGDYVIGGVFSIHAYVHALSHNYTKLPGPVSCRGSIESRELRFSQAMVFAIKEINNSTELLPGITLGYQIHDSCGSVPLALHAAFQLSNGKDHTFYSSKNCSQSGMVIAVIGESGSTPSISISRLIGSFDVPQVSHFATCACLSDKQQYPTFFRTIPSDQFQADALAKLVKHFGWTWIGAVRSDSDYGNNGMAAFLEAAQKEGICVEYSESFHRTHPRSRIQRVAEAIRRSTAVVVVAFVASGDMKILLEELSLEHSPPRQWIGSEAWVTNRDMLKYSFCTGAIGFGIQKSVIPGLREFLLDLSPSTVAASPVLTEFWEDVFDCRLGKREAKVERVCDGSEDIQTLQNPYTDTSQLRITNMVYKAVYAIAHAIHNAVCQDTHSATHCDKSTRIEPKQILSNLKNVHFSQNGYYVSFDAKGDPVAKYELVNWQKTESGSIEMVAVGLYDASLPVGQEFHIGRKLTWMDSGTQVPVSVCSDSCPPGTRKVLQKGKPICCYDCIPCPEGEISNTTDSPDCLLCPQEFWPNAERDTCLLKPVEFLSFDEVLGIILAAFSVAGACLAIITAAVFFHHRTSPIVRANNSELSFLLLFSLTLCFLCSLTFIGAPSEWSCRLRHTAFGITFVLCISSLFFNISGDGLKKRIVLEDERTNTGVSTEASSVKCKLQGTTRQPAFSMDGDYVIGGVFSVHTYMQALRHDYTTMPEPLRCTGSIESRELRFSRAMIFAIEEINNSTELLSGIKLGYEIHDSCASVPLTMHAAFQLSNGRDPVFYTDANCSQSGKVMAVVGESGSTPSISMSRIIGSFDIPQVSYFATCACLSDKQQYPTFFRTIPSDQFQADALAKLVKHFGWTWIGAVRSDSDYGNNGMAAFLEAAQKEGICVEYSESFHRTHPRSRVQRVADVIRRSTAVVIVAFVASGDMRILLEELSQEISPPRQWIGSESWVTNRDMLKFSFCVGAIGFGIERSIIPGLREFLLNLSPAKVAASPLLTEFWEEAFNCRPGKNAAEGMRACNGSEDLQTLQSPYTDTSQLRITNMVYKAVYAIAHAIHNEVCQDNNSTTQCDKSTRIEPKQVLSQLQKIHFSQNGYDVSFDASGDPVAKYELVNWQKMESGSTELLKIGLYDASVPLGQEFRINKNIIWMEGGTLTDLFEPLKCHSYVFYGIF